MAPPMLIPVILAAGESSRMGCPKPYLRLPEGAFVEVIAARLHEAGVSANGVIVFNPAHRDLLDAARLPHFRAVPNHNRELGPLHSLHLAIGHIPKASGVILCLADHPLVAVFTYGLMADAHAESPNEIILPAYEGRTGHPVILPSALFEGILELDPRLPGGLGRFLAGHPLPSRTISVDDPGILADLDTREEYLQALGGQAPQS